MIKLIILFLIAYVSSTCFMSYEKMNKIPITKLSLVPQRCRAENSIHDNILDCAYFNFFISNGSDAFVLNNKTQCDISVQGLSLDNYITIQWMNITEMSINPFHDMFNIYINGDYIKPISMFSCAISYVSYISNECGSDAYDINMYNIIHPPGSYSTAIMFKINTFGTYRNMKV